MSWDSVWEKIFQEQAWGKYPPEELIRFIARNFYQVPNRKEVKILEVGCGPGANIWYLAREGFSVYGVEGSQTAVERALIRLDKECPGWTGQIKKGDINRLPFENDYFDAVIDLEAVSCNAFDASKNIYAEMARVVKKGGKLFSKTFSVGTWGDGTGQNLGRNAWRTADGPLTGKGLTRFTDYADIGTLIKDFRIQQVELKTYTMNDRQKIIKEWIIFGEKP